MQFKTYYLAFDGPLHLGNHRPDTYEGTEDYLRSDTIVAAIYATWAKMGKEDWIPVDGSPSFTVSSAYPYIQVGDSKEHFFPRPKMKFNNDIDNLSSRKKIKKVKWLEQRFFEDVIGGRPIDYGDDEKYLIGDYLTHGNDPSQSITKDINQRVSIPRLDAEKDAEPFYMQRILFDNAGLYFMIDGDNDRVREAMQYLQHEGFGTDRTVGHGFFHLEEGHVTLNVPDQHEHSTNLSLLTPESAEQFETLIQSDLCGYDTIERGGWITTQGFIGKKKKTVRMFVEGSIWSTTQAIEGVGAINLRPSTLTTMHPIWRSGRSIMIPVKL